MKRVFVLYIGLIIALTCGATACVSKRNTVKVIKPKKHLFTYNPRWHKKVKRTKVVRMRN